MKRVLLLLVLSLLGSFSGQAAPRPSLRELLSGLKSSESIVKAFAATKTPAGELKTWLEENQKLRSEFQKMSRESQAFARGEIENETVLNQLTVLLQLSLLRCRWGQGIDTCSDEAQTWFQFLADLSYEESTLVGLRFAHLGRSLWFDELEAQQQKDRMFLSNSRAWLAGLRAPWPLDRIVVFEARRILKPQALRTVERLATSLQKNPYQSAEAALNKIPGGKSKDFDFIRQMWRSEDLDLLKNEANRLALLKVKAAQGAYFKSQSKVAVSYEELMAQKLLPQIPTDYKTGKALVFPIF